MNSNKKIWINAAAIAVGVAVANLTYKYLRKRTEELSGFYTPLIDTISSTIDGVVREVMTFGYDDDERCTWARSIHLDSNGEFISEKLIEAEYYEDKILISEGTDDSGDTPTLTTMLLDEFGMVSSVIMRHPLGNEERWDAVVNGAEMSSLVSNGVEGTFKWMDGNIESINYNDGTSVKLFYYNSVENHIFPDLNILNEGLSADMITTYLLGTRTRNFVSNAEYSMADGSQKDIHCTYLCDHFDRPLQVIQEIAQKDVNGLVEKKQVVYDVAYAK